MGGKLNLCSPAEVEGPAEISVSNICECVGCLPPPLHAVVPPAEGHTKDLMMSRWNSMKQGTRHPNQMDAEVSNGHFSSARQQRSNSAITGQASSSTILLKGALFHRFFSHGRIALKLTTV